MSENPVDKAKKELAKVQKARELAKMDSGDVAKLGLDALRKKSGLDDVESTATLTKEDLDADSTYKGLIDKAIDITSRGIGLGPSGASTYTVINGLSTVGGVPQLPVNTDNQGYTFFTKPQLNLTYDNVITNRRMSAYADQRPDNLANVIRCLLQPPGFVPEKRPENKPKHMEGLPGDSDDPDIRSSLVDDKNPFITILSNMLLSLNGWPDLSPDTYTSNEGIAKEVVSWIDDRPYLYGPFDLSATFGNMEGNLLSHFFHCWNEYATRVAEGSMSPFPINVMTNRVDYQTKIYRIVLDRTRRYLQGICATIAYPVAYPIGRSFDFNSQDKLNTESSEVSTQFRCIGAEYNDPILIKEFNKLVSRFNPDMLAKVEFADPNGTVENGRKGMALPNPDVMVEIRESEKLIYNFKCYPFIADNNEFLWFTPKAIYDAIQSYISKPLIIQ